MLIYKNLHRALHEAQEECAALAAKNAALEADLYYLAMMASISLEEEKKNDEA
jgi:hypothetical protein